MQILIIVTIIVMFLVLIGWMWVSLGNNMSKSKKVICMLIGILFSFLVTLIDYKISKIGLTYSKEIVEKRTELIYVLLYTIINGYILLPYLFRLFEKVKLKEIEIEGFKKRILIIAIVFILLIIGECNYFKNAQIKILEYAK